jgi:integrase
MASIQKRGAGYRAFVLVHGKRESKTFRLRREAEIWAAGRESEARHESTPSETHSLAEALIRYRDEVTPSKRGERWERIRIDHFLRLFPVDLPLAKLTPAMLAEWRNARLKDVSAGTVRREFTLLSAVLETARKEWQWVRENPVRDVRMPPEPKHRERVISCREIRAMLKAMNYTGAVQTVSDAVAVAFLVALRTGMRAGELCNLRWDDVHEGYCHLPTSKTGARDVPLTPKALRLIERMRRWDRDLVFAVQSRTLYTLFRRYRAKAGLSGFTFHDARHTAATWIVGRMRANGIPAQQAILDLCKVFGWTNTSRALTYYNPSAADIARRIM